MNSPQTRKNWLSQAERLLQTDLRYLIGGGSWLALGQFVASASIFVLAIAFANLVPKEVYGTYKYVQSIAGILAITGMSGMNTYIAAAVARGKEATFISGMKARMRWGLLGAVGSILVSLYYLHAGNLLLAETFLIVAAATPFVDALGLYNVYLQSKKQFRTAILYFSVVQIASIAVLFVTIFFTHNLLVLVTAYFLPPIALRYFFYRRTLITLPPNTEDDPKAIRYGAHLSIVNVLGTLAGYIDTILLYHLLGPIPVALYSFALAPVDQIRTLYSKNLPSLALPKLAQRSMRSINSILTRRLILLSAVGIVVAVGYAVMVPYAFALFFPKYLSAVALSKTLAILLIITLPSTYLATTIQAKIHIMPRSWIYFAVIPDILHIIALIISVPLYGVYGLVIAKGVDAFSALVVSFIQWKKLSLRIE